MASTAQDLVDRALSNKRESKYIEFKSEFDVQSKQAWCEVLKDIVAIANSGGGAIAFGLDNKGLPSGFDVQSILDLDPAVIVDKLHRYTSLQYDGFQLFEAEKQGSLVAILLVEPADQLLVFTKPGTFPLPDSKQARAFSQGVVYFRHGAKSEPAHPADLAQFVSNQVESARREWMRRVQRVVRAPSGYQVRVLPKQVFETDSNDGTPIRIVDDEDAPGYQKIDPDKTHPYRQKELLEEVNRRLPSTDHINSYDIQAIRAVHDIEGKARYFHKPKFGSPQYSPALATWIVEQFNDDPHFFENARRRLYNQRHGA